MNRKGKAYIKGGPLVYEILSDSLDLRKEGERLPVKIVANYPDESLLISRLVIGDELIRKKGSVLSVRVVTGNIILFGFNVQKQAPFTVPRNIQTAV